MSVTEEVTLGWENISSSYLTGNNSTAPFENATLLPEYDGTSPKELNIRPSVGVVYLSYITLPLFVVVGIFGNILTIIISRHKEYRTTSHGLLITAMAVTDIIYLARFAAIASPLKARLVITRRTTWIAVACAFVLTASVSGACASFAGIKQDKCFHFVISHENFKLGQVFNVIGMLMRTFIPAGTLVMFTPITAVKLYRQYTIRRHMTSSNTTDKDDAGSGPYRVNLMLSSVVLAYLLLVVPFCIAKSMMLMNGLNNAPYKWARNLYEISNIFEAANCVVNVLLYSLLNASFRRKVFDLLNVSKRVDVECAS